jgi:hypothetical protein
MRAALYTRVSTKDKGQETANQLRQLREFCASQAWTIVQEYEDHDSGSKADRVQFKAMMASRRSGKSVRTPSTSEQPAAWFSGSTCPLGPQVTEPASPADKKQHFRLQFIHLCISF